MMDPDTTSQKQTGKKMCQINITQIIMALYDLAIIF